MTIYTPRHDNTSAHQAQKASDDLTRYQRKVQADEASRQACPVPGAVLSSWQPPTSWGRIIERVPTRVRGIPAEMLRFANGQFVCRLVAVLHGLIGP